MKDFDTWNKEKKKLETIPLGNITFHERDVWWCSIGLNVGDEEDGKHEFFERPVLVLRRFNAKIAWVVPITTKEKLGPYYWPLPRSNKNFYAILSQLRLISVKRFRRFIRKIPNKDTLEIKRRLADLIMNIQN